MDESDFVMDFEEDLEEDEGRPHGDGSESSEWESGTSSESEEEEEAEVLDWGQSNYTRRPGAPPKVPKDFPWDAPKHEIQAYMRIADIPKIPSTSLNSVLMDSKLKTNRNPLDPKLAQCQANFNKHAFIIPFKPDIPEKIGDEVIYKPLANGRFSGGWSAMDQMFIRNPAVGELPKRQLDRASEVAKVAITDWRMSDTRNMQPSRLTIKPYVSLRREKTPKTVAAFFDESLVPELDSEQLAALEELREELSWEKERLDPYPLQEKISRMFMWEQKFVRNATIPPEGLERQLIHLSGCADWQPIYRVEKSTNGRESAISQAVNWIYAMVMRDEVLAPAARLAEMLQKVNTTSFRGEQGLLDHVFDDGTPGMKVMSVHKGLKISLEVKNSIGSFYTVMKASESMHQYVAENGKRRMYWTVPGGLIPEQIKYDCPGKGTVIAQHANRLIYSATVFATTLENAREALLDFAVFSGCLAMVNGNRFPDIKNTKQALLEHAAKNGYKLNLKYPETTQQPGLSESGTSNNRCKLLMWRNEVIPRAVHAIPCRIMNTLEIIADNEKEKPILMQPMSDVKMPAEMWGPCVSANSFERYVAFFKTHVTQGGGVVQSLMAEERWAAHCFAQASHFGYKGCSEVARRLCSRSQDPALVFLLMPFVHGELNNGDDDDGMSYTWEIGTDPCFDHLGDPDRACNKCVFGRTFVTDTDGYTEEVGTQGKRLVVASDNPLRTPTVIDFTVGGEYSRVSMDVQVEGEMIPQVNQKMTRVGVSQTLNISSQVETALMAREVNMARVLKRTLVESQVEEFKSRQKAKRAKQSE